MWNADGFEGLPYRVLLPEGYAPATTRYPLVVFLHGSGERGNDNKAQLDKGIRALEAPGLRRRYPCIVVAPQAPAGGSFGGTWYRGQWGTQDAVARLTDELRRKKSVDPSRCYLLGLSMGAIGGWELLVRHPGRFAAAGLVCGEPDVAWTEALQGLPLWAFHGAQDDVVKPGPAREVCRLLEKAGSPVRYTEYPQVGHVSWDLAFAEAELYTWLFSQRRK